jgi:hypothetical protein
LGQGGITFTENNFFFSAVIMKLEGGMKHKIMQKTGESTGKQWRWE